jgi:hypothetical protein
MPALTTVAMAQHPTNSSWINVGILVGSGIFVFGLIVSAVFAPQWRALHALQSLIYVALVVMTRRRSAYGFGAGVGIAVFWNSLGIFATTMMQEAVQQLWAAIRDGSLPQPDLLLQLLAFGGHVLIIIACIVGFSRARPSAREWGRFVAGAGLAIGYLVAIVFAVGPPTAVTLFRRVFGL